LAYDEIVFLPITPTGDVFLQQAVLLAHRGTDFRTHILDGRVVLLEPFAPMTNAGAYIEQTLDFDVVVAGKGKYELAQCCMVIGLDDPSLRILVEPLVVRFVEASESIHGAQSIQKSRDP
jgi:hypothetical protein